MAVGVSGYVEFDSSVSWGKVRVYYEETYNIDTNKSDVKITEIKVKSTNWYGVTYYPDGLVKVNGTTVVTCDSSTGTHAVRIDSQETWCTIYKANTETAAGGTVSGISHNPDGSKSVSIQLTGNRYNNFNFFTLSGDYGSGWYIGASKNIALTPIPRASEIGATDADIESKSTIVVYRKSDSYTHTIQYEFGSLSGYITASGGVTPSATKFSNTTIAWTIPRSFYNQIPNAKTGVCTLRIKTYSGSTQIGSEQTTTFKVTAAQALCLPLVSGSVEDVNEVTVALTGDSRKLVKFYSTALCTIAAQAVNGATIVSTYINEVDVTTTNELEVSSVESESFKLTAVDSRGYSSTVLVVAPLVVYTKLTSNPTASRPQPTTGDAILVLRGDYFNESFGATENTLSAKYRISSGAWQTVEVVIDGNTYNATVELTDLAYNQSFQFEVVVADALSTISKNVPLRKGIPVFDWGEDDFAFHTPVNMNGNRISNFIEMGQWLNKSVNDLPLNSVAWVAPSTTDLPYSGSGIYGYIETWAAYRSIYFQRISYLSGRCYIRMYYNSVWHNWVRVDVGTVTLDSLGAEANLSNGTYTKSLDGIAENGIVWINGSSISGSPTGAYGFVETWCPDENTRFQRLTTTTGHVCQRQYHTGAWTDWEWINPPMTTGVTYRTTERWNGYPVYVRNVSCGTLTEGRKVVSVSDLANSRIIEARGYATNSSGASYLIPSINYDMTDPYTVVLLVNTHSSGGDIQIFSGSSIAGKTAYVQIRFIKP